MPENEDQYTFGIFPDRDPWHMPRKYALWGSMFDLDEWREWLAEYNLQPENIARIRFRKRTMIVYSYVRDEEGVIKGNWDRPLGPKPMIEKQRYRLFSEPPVWT